MTFTLAPQISFGFVGPDAVVLDLRADRYLRLGRDDADMLRGLAAGDRMEPPAAAPDRLCRTGILIAGSGAVVPVRAAAIASSAVEATSLSNSPKEPGLVEVLASRASAARWLEVAGLSRTVGRWRKLRSRAGSFEAHERSSLVDLARGFQRRLRYYPARRRCVQDSLALMRCLWRRNLDADLYFGVRLDPFAAHCWVQSNDLLLSDPAASVAEFAPVFQL